jgi:hypothetical protein
MGIKFAPMKILRILFEIVLILAALFLISKAPEYVTSRWWPGKAFGIETGTIGDTIGGIAGPLISALSAVLVYIAFKEQVKANRLIQDQFEIQGVYDELDSMEEYCDQLEEKLWSRLVLANGRFKVAEHNSDSILLRAWSYRLGVARDMMSTAQKTKNPAVIDRVKYFIEERLNPLVKTLNDRIPDQVEKEALAAWRTAYDDYFKK